MPAQSRAQFKLMQAVAHNQAVAKQTGIPQSVGQEYAAATPSPGKLPEHKRRMMAEALRKK